VSDPVKQTLFQGLSWTDVVLNPRKILDTGKRLPQAAGNLPGVLGSAVKGFPDAVSGAVKEIPGAIGKGIVKAAVMNTVGLFVRDAKWYINRGGYRDKVDEDLKPHQKEINVPEDEIMAHEGNYHAPPPEEAVYVITMGTPDGAGDGTVPESSARALNPFAGAEVKCDKKGKKIKRTFSIGDASGVETESVKKNAPRTMPKSAPEFDEGWFDRGHEPVYKTKSAQHITSTVIESICRRCLAAHREKK
jgi:hypothetical protein